MSDQEFVTEHVHESIEKRWTLVAWDKAVVSRHKLWAGHGSVRAFFEAQMVNVQHFLDQTMPDGCGLRLVVFVVNDGQGGDK